MATTPRKMKPTRTESESRWRRSALLAGLAFLIAGQGALAGASAVSGYNDVQVSVTTSAQLRYSYTYNAYNLTGSLVATYQSSLPAAAFELPSGEYLFTVSAVAPPTVTCYECLPMTGAGQGGANASGPTGGVAVPPITVYRQQASEYGYAIVEVTSSQTVSVATKNVTEFPTTPVAVSVRYVNGTAAAGASVSASIVGQWYYWWGQASAVTMYAQAGQDGVAHLVLPSAPAVVTAWSWVPVYLPTSQTTIVKNIGGEDVNVTVYWEPTYVGLSGSQLVVPPATSANITLRYQQPDYWVMPAGAQYEPGSSGGASTATVSDQPQGVPAQASQASGTQYFAPQQIPSLQPDQVSPGLKTPGYPAWTLVAAAATVAAVTGLAAYAIKTKRGPPAALA
jgi:hypothetical protein